MTAIYFGVLLVLIVVGYLFGRSRAVAASQAGHLHSRPPYHGAFVALGVLVPMIAVFAIGIPVADRIVNAQTIASYDPGFTGDELQRAAVLRDINAVATNDLFRSAHAAAPACC